MNKNVFFKTYGCSFNQLDSQVMKANLKKAGYNIVDSDNDAQIIVLNSCTVKNGSEAKFFHQINYYKKLNKTVIAAGCVPQAETSLLENKLKNISTIGNNNLSQITTLVESSLKNKVIHSVSPTLKKRLNEYERLELEQIRLKKDRLRDNDLIEIIPINEGCLNNCTYCKTKQARGNLFSYSIDNIKTTMQNAINQGVKEIWLTSQDTGCYGFDINTNLVELLKELLKIDGDYRIRIGMGNPNHFKKIIDDVLDLMLSDNRIYKFLHIPVQSGNNRILNEMKRLYLVEEYENIIMKAKLKIPGITISNDIIVASPTEKFEEFKDTLNTLKKTKINVLNFSRFWLRPNTQATKIYFKKDLIDGLESKKRAQILKEEFEKIALKNNQKWLAWEGIARVIEEGKNNTLILRNDYYKPIYIENKNNIKLGSKVKVKINKVTWKDFYAELI